MRKTKDARIAMERLAEVLGWTIRADGGSWVVDHPADAEGLTFDARELLCTMTRIAMAPERWKGRGLTADALRRLIRFEPEHLFHPSKGPYLDLPSSISSTVETTMYRAFFRPEMVG